MSDYGHDLQFGTFLTPDGREADRVVELAMLTEVAGLDLVTVQDHPYQARFLDAWALLATVLARTTSRCGWRRTWRTCRCARRSCWRGRSPASTC